MQSDTFTFIFAATLLVGLLLRFWLATRQMRHVSRHRAQVPTAFVSAITPEAHRQAADYTMARLRFGLLSMAFGAAVLLAWTLLGGLDSLNAALREALQPRYGNLAYQLALVTGVSLIGMLLDLPFELWQTFRIEQRFGFNRITPRLYASDFFKNLVFSALLGLPLAAAVLWVMGAAGSLWWLWAGGLSTAYILLVQGIYPTWIAPFFNKFEPLKDEALRTRVENLMKRCGFSSRGLFVMDGSRRSAHSNAYFTGLGASKRVVFFDTLLARLSPQELEAVLAHELGHFHHRHVLKRLVGLCVFVFATFALLGWLSGQAWFYTGLGVRPNLAAPNDALALILLMMVAPLFAFFVSPLFSGLSRRQEFQADAYACEHASNQALSAALIKLIEDNATTLTPDPLYVRFYYSHPPAAERLAALARHRSLTPVHA